MNDEKNKQVIMLRLTRSEKDKLKEEANGCCMNITQYIKYKLFEADGESSFNKSTFLDQNIALLTRVLINGYFHIRLLGLKHLSKEELDKVHTESEEEFKKLGISKQTEQQEQA